MNVKRLVLAVLAVFVFVNLTDYLTHEVWLKPDYLATMSLWRPHDEMMQRYFGWLLAGQFVYSLAFVVLYAKGFAGKNRLCCAVMFGLLMGIFFEANTLVTYAVQPLPGGLAVKWFLACLAQTAGMGFISFFVYKPKPGSENNACGETKK